MSFGLRQVLIIMIALALVLYIFAYLLRQNQAKRTVKALTALFALAFTAEVVVITKLENRWPSGELMHGTLALAIFSVIYSVLSIVGIFIAKATPVLLRIACFLALVVLLLFSAYRLGTGLRREYRPANDVCHSINGETCFN